MGETILRSDVSTAIQEALQQLTTEIVLATSSPEVITSVIEQQSQEDEDKQLAIISDESALKQAVSTFSIATSAADLIESNQLTLHETDAVQSEGTVFATAQTIISIINGGDTIAALISNNEEITTNVSDRYARIQSEASAFTLRTPSLSTIRTSLKETFDQSVVDDFEKCVHINEAGQESENQIDEVMIALLVTAKHELQLYKISKWGDDIGLASRATFSRKKRLLVAEGLIKTEKIPMDVGRPRLRLILDNKTLETSAIDELADVANDLLKEEGSN